MNDKIGHRKNTIVFDDLSNDVKRSDVKHDDIDKKDQKEARARKSACTSFSEKKKKNEKKAIPNQPCYVTKVVITGDLGVGKTSLVNALVGPDKITSMKGQRTGRVKTEFRRTNHSIKMDIWDTAGQERYRSLTASYYRGAHGCLVLYDVTNKTSYENITSWLTDLKQYTANPDQIATIVVGTRCHAKIREVPKEKAETFAYHIGFPYMEVSSEEDINVREVFDLLAENMIQTFKRHPSIIIDPPVTTKLTENEQKKKFSLCSC